MPIKICFSEIYTKVCIGKQMSQEFLLQNGLKQGDGVIRNVQEYHMELKLNRTHQLSVYSGAVILLGHNRNTIKKNREALTDVTKDAGIEINAVTSPGCVYRYFWR